MWFRTFVHLAKFNCLDLSVIIVNYNVKFFLEQCLYSVTKAIQTLSVEVIVIDNQSADQSIEYLKPKFPGVIFISNSENVGFAKACNIGYQRSQGNHILFLNPDTIVAENTFTSCIHFFENHADCGAIGVKMIDGSGHFLKESKRAFPAPLTALFKLFGLARAFPESKTFGRYHLGHLSNNATHEVDVLAGAFLMVRRTVLKTVGVFDELFFMYVEDVDLSYRIQKAGYKNYYLADTTIIHFKGESTKKSSINYVRVFYKAMSQFVKKHYSGSKAGLFNVVINIAIWTRAILSLLGKAIRYIGLPLIDAIIIFISFWLVKEVWSQFIRPDIIYSNKLLLILIISFTLLFQLAAYYAGLYKKYYRTASLVRSTSIAAIFLIVIYAMLPEHLRFSRGIVILGAVLAFIMINLLRTLMIRFKLIREPLDKILKPYILIAGNKTEFISVLEFLKKSGLSDKVIGRVSINGNDPDSITRLAYATETGRSLEAEEIIFCAGTLSYEEIINYVEENENRLKYRFHAVQSESIISSETNRTQGEILSLDSTFKLAHTDKRRTKRMFDILFALFGLITFPIQFLFVSHTIRFFGNCIKVLRGNRTWIGYLLPEPSLPPLRKGILGPNGMRDLTDTFLTDNSKKMVDYWYAHDYEPIKDLIVLVKNYKYLGS